MAKIYYIFIALFGVNALFGINDKNIVNIQCLLNNCDELAIESAVVPMKPSTPYEKRASLVALAESKMHVRELTGRNDGEEVEMYLKSVGRRKGDAWCAAFLYWLHKENNITAPKSGWSPSWFPKNNTVYHKGRYSKMAWQPGDVAGIYSYSKKRIAHVCMVRKVTDKWCYTIEGNSNDGGSFDGIGVFARKRSLKGIEKISNYVDIKY